MKFPADFSRGAADRDGGGHSIGDMFGRHEGRIIGGATGEIACNHYHRYREGVGLIADPGLQAGRFPVSWRRAFLPNDINKL